MRADLAESFFRRALQRQQCLILLDGLDEVTAQHYSAVLHEIHRFMHNKSPEMTSSAARMVITCRRQNFMTIQDEWVGPIVAQSYRLAPFRNAEIYHYLDNIRAAFRRPNGPEDFMVALRNSGTLELHRTPLVLAMSVGVFAKKDYYEIPHAISELYRLIVSEMLDRHRFKDDPLGSANRFRVRDKYTFLRGFAHQAATGSIGFDEFRRRDLVTAAAATAEHLEALPAERVDEFIGEILERSGLLSPVDGQRYVFAHRSIQEHLVAEELLLRDVSGAELAMDRSADGDWRQVVLLYAAAADQQPARRVPRRPGGPGPRPGRALPGQGDAPDRIAIGILDRLGQEVRNQSAVAIDLSALLAATSSPRLVVQRAAIDAACEALNVLIAKRADVIGALGGDLHAVGRVLNAIADANSTQVASLLPALIALVPDDPVLVEPLWRCLATDGIEQNPARYAIVDRLVTLVMDPDCLATLQDLEPHTRPSITAKLREKVYPFEQHSRSSNLVTLLASMDSLGVDVARPNRYLQALSADPKALVGVARAHKRFGANGAPGFAMRTWYVAFVGYLATVAGAAWVLVERPIEPPHGWRGWAVPVMPIVLSALVNVRARSGRGLAPLHQRGSRGVYMSMQAHGGVLIRLRRRIRSCSGREGQTVLGDGGRRAEPRPSSPWHCRAPWRSRRSWTTWPRTSG